VEKILNYALVQGRERKGRLLSIKGECYNPRLAFSLI